MVLYVPGTDETDQKMQNRALQHSAAAITAAQDDIATVQSDLGTVQSDLGTVQSDLTTAQSDITAAQSAIAALIPSGTRMLFQQTSAPTGWTKETAHNDKVLRVVSGTASAGGTNPFSTVMAQTTTGNHTLALSEIPSHGHSYIAGGGFATSVDVGITVSVAAPGSGSTTGSQGGGGAHNHPITMAMQYVDLIIAIKD